MGAVRVWWALPSLARSQLVLALGACVLAFVSGATEDSTPLIATICTLVPLLVLCGYSWIESRHGEVVARPMSWYGVAIIAATIVLPFTMVLVASATGELPSRSPWVGSLVLAEIWGLEAVATTLLAVRETQHRRP